MRGMHIRMNQATLDALRDAYATTPSQPWEPWHGQNVIMGVPVRINEALPNYRYLLVDDETGRILAEYGLAGHAEVTE